MVLMRYLLLPALFAEVAVADVAIVSIGTTLVALVTGLMARAVSAGALRLGRA
jgi:putative effector of murein hydrolase LrgA (UPF0299 family)